MNEPKFTSGPWEVCGDGVNVFAPETDTSITDVVHPCTTPIEEQEANARLIAISPRMYEYLEKQARDGDLEAQRIIEEVKP